MYAQIIEGIREEIKDFEAAENREDKVDMLLQCYGSFAGDSTLASDIDDDTIETEKADATTRVKANMKAFESRVADVSSKVSHHILDTFPLLNRLLTPFLEIVSLLVKASSGGRSRFSVTTRFSRVARSMKPFGRLMHRMSTDSPKSRMVSRIRSLPPQGRPKTPISSKSARAQGLYEESQQPMGKKSGSCHSESCDPAVTVQSSDEDSSLRVQLDKSQTEKKSPLLVEIGNELVEIDLASDDEPTVPGMETLLSPGTSKDEIEDPPNEGLPAVAEDKTETPSEDGEGGAPTANDKMAAENAGKPPSELPGAAGDAEISGTKKRDLSKGFEVVRIRTGKEKIRPSTRTSKYVALSKKHDLVDEERIKAEKAAEKAREEAEKVRKEAERVRREAEEAEKARKEADRKANKISRKADKIRRREAERARKEAEKEAERARKEADMMAEKVRRKAEKEELEKKKKTKKKGIARIEEEKFAARQLRKMAQNAQNAQNDEANFNAPTPKWGNKSAILSSPSSESESSKEFLPKSDRAKTRDKASEGEGLAKDSSNDKKSPMSPRKHASGKGAKPKTQKRVLTPVIETASSESSSEENRPTENVKKAPSHRRFKSPLRTKKSTAEDGAEEGEQGAPSSGKAKSPKKQGMRSKSAGRKTKPGKSKPREPMSRTEPVSKSPSGYVPLAKRTVGFAPSLDVVDDESSSSSDEDDVRDEYESSRRGRRGRGSRGPRRSRRFIKRDSTFETIDSRYDSFGGYSHNDSFGGDSRYESFGGDSYEDGDFPVSIFDDVLDSLERVGERLIGDDKPRRRGRASGRASIPRTESSTSYIDGYAM